MAGKESTLDAREHLEQVVRGGEERFRLLFENSHDLMAVFTADFRTVWVNPAWQEVFGREPPSRENPLGVIHPDDLPEVQRAWKELVCGGREVRDFEFRVHAVDGTYRTLDASSFQVDQGDEKLSYIIAHDVTRRKEAEQRAAALQAELAHMGRVSTMGEMASGLAHELNQPLTAIATLAHVAGQGLRSGSEPDKARLSEMCDDIGAQALRAGRLIRRMRSFVKKIGPRRTTLDVREVLHEILHLTENDIRLAGVAIRLDVDESLPTTFADKIQVEQVLLNLVRNALESMNRSDRDDHQLTIEACACDGNLQIVVRDTGVGIPEDRIDDLFGTFYTTKPEGMGMGLAICRSIVEGHGGRIWAAPNADRGATFTFTLPIVGKEDKDGR